ncbi:MAG: helix-turn-helix transcriptional regulator [Actinomycetota bacterium]
MRTAPKSTDDHRDPIAARRRLLSPADVASYLAVPLRTVYGWRSRGEGPRGYRVGRHVRFMLDDVERWLEDHRDAS